MVDDVVLGVASQVGEQGADLARTANLLNGWPTPGVTLNRFCASGIDAVATAAARVRAGDYRLVVAGGVESVSRVPIFSDGGALWNDPSVVKSVGSVHMGIAADLNATLEGFTRDQLDAYAVETHAKAHAAWESGAFDYSVIETNDLARDELIRPGLSAEALSGLAPVFGDRPDDDALVLERFERIEHLHTVGTSPQMADAAALLLIGTREQADAVGLRPRARIVSSTTATCDPVIMLTAGQEAMEQAIERAGLAPRDIDVFEFAEAFAALCLRFRRDLDAGPERMNPNGGTIAMGHAFGATGAIMVGVASTNWNAARAGSAWQVSVVPPGSASDWFSNGARTEAICQTPASRRRRRSRVRSTGDAVTPCTTIETSTVNETVAQSRSARTKAACPRA